MSVSQCNELYEESQNAQINEQEREKNKRCRKCLGYLFCWRENRSNTKVFSQEEKNSIQKAE